MKQKSKNIKRSYLAWAIKGKGKVDTDTIRYTRKELDDFILRAGERIIEIEIYEN